MLKKIFEESKKDNSLSSSLNINDLLKGVDETNGYLKNKKMADILREIDEVLTEFEFENMDHYRAKLAKHRLVEKVYELHKGKTVKLLCKDKKKLIFGGIVLNIKIVDTGVQLLCMCHNHIFQYKFDNYYIFQKLSAEEEMILHFA